MHDVIIIGGGPAGTTAGIYAVRKGLDTLVIAKDFVGQAGNAAVVENWPGEKEISGIELMQKFEDHLRHIGPKIIEGEIVTEIARKEDGAFNVSTAKEGEIEGKAVIVTAGRNPRPLKVPGEEKFSGRGVSYCVVCDGPLFKNKEVVVAGGGNSAYESALELSNYCKKVHILSLRIIADKALQEKAKNAPNIEEEEGAKLEEIKGENMVSSVMYKKGEESREVAAEGVFVSIGSVPVTEFLGDLVEFTERGEVKIDHFTCETVTPGLFAAGDVTNVRDKQIIVAAAEGAKAAITAHKYLNQ